MPRKRAPRIRICEWCGHLIGPDRGPAAKTCSEECQRDRNNDKEKKRYQKVKDTPEWKEARADYLERVREKIEKDPAFAEDLRTRHRAAVAKYRSIENADPVRRQESLERKREWMRMRSARINADPIARAAKLKKQREWYRSLSSEERDRIFYEPLRTRKFESQILEKLELAALRAEDKRTVNVAKKVLNHREWSSEEVEYLRKHYATQQASDIAAKLRRTTTAVTQRAFAMGLVAQVGRELGGREFSSKNRVWSSKEDAVLRKWLGKYSAPVISEALDRTLFSVKRRIRVLKLSEKRPRLKA